MPKNQPAWVFKAKKLIGELSDLAQVTLEVQQSRSFAKLSHAERIEAFQEAVSSWNERLSQHRKAERILWNLWLTTGKPPLIREENETVKTFLRRNAVDYGRYVTKHAGLTQKELHRIGLANAIDSFGSPLWYMTLKYVTHMTGLGADWTVDIRTTPSHLIVECRS
ncbi:unnamed protein product, partial [marine sediment metagenome]